MPAITADKDIGSVECVACAEVVGTEYGVVAE